MPCSGWLFVGPRHRCFRGLLRQLAQDAARFAHVQFYLCVQGSTPLNFGPLAQKFGGLAGVRVVLDEGGFYGAAVRGAPLILQFFDKKNKLVIETEDYAQFLEAVQKRESKKQRAAREQLEKEWAGDEERRVQAFYLEETGSRVRSRTGAGSRAGAGNGAESALGVLGASGASGMGASGVLGLTGSDVRGSQAGEVGGADAGKDAIQSLSGVKAEVGTGSVSQRVSEAAELREGHGSLDETSNNEGQPAAENA